MYQLDITREKKYTLSMKKISHLHRSSQNPSGGSDCSGIKSSNSYCVEAFDEPTLPEETITSTTSTSTSTITTSEVLTTPPPTMNEASTTTTPTTTSASNGVQTPAPVHNGIVSNCNKFYMVQYGDSLASIAQKNNVRAADIVAWNGLNSGCTNLWLDTYTCVGIIGGTPTVLPTTTTTARNGIQTPQPTQPSIVSNCDKFHLVGDGDTCAKIASTHGMSTAQLTQWNILNGACSNLWGAVYACVCVIGFTPTPTPTNAGNGIETPQTSQGSIVANCKKFEFVYSGDTCETVAKRRGIMVKQMTTWNPSIHSDCKKLWANAYTCVGV
ncbi:hypothetical protein AJ79_01946 [Helicocarpus griseus UAMH5409]|uniref:LysM domain-containing protein n=1 Tax=Helicocarpus griseus UAMH5409 TaxID=1447875 RepID=A0A2B7Y4X4_9EURO|nr:hypothetical protein AJ79_01946 [Helicocarpus griseus UAMH5409]